MNLSNLHLEFRKLLKMPLFSVSSTKTTLASALVVGAVLAAPFALGCASAPVNPPLETIDPTGGYRFVNTAPGENNSDELFVMVSLSGGGTRATALDYGVLAHLDEIGIGSGDRSLLDEVDLIASSSAASLAAAYFGLFGQERFLRSFRDEVLYRKLEGALKRRFLTPWQWPRMWSSRFSRSDLAAEYIDRQIFEEKTYADMPRKRPFVLINATDLSLGALFSFSQGQFDLLCSNLDGVSVGRAVTASMALHRCLSANDLHQLRRVILRLLSP